MSRSVSVISPVLFNIMVKNILSKVEGNYGMSLFADDGPFGKGAETFHTSSNKHKEHLIGSLNRQMNGASKYQQIQNMSYLALKERTRILVCHFGINRNRKKPCKYLEVWFDERLTWCTHVGKTTGQSEKVINVMQCLAGSSCDQKYQPCIIYRAMICSVLDYGCLAYSSAVPTLLAKLDILYAKALSVCSGLLLYQPWGEQSSLCTSGLK